MYFYNIIEPKVQLLYVDLFCFRIGVNGFDNPMRDPKTEEVKKHVGLVSTKKTNDNNIFNAIII